MKKLYKSKFRVVHSFLILVIISFSFIAGDCNKVLVDDGSIPTEYIGNWKLSDQTGALQDICPDETVNFLSTGVAELTCPGSDLISRDFTVQNSVLSYTQTSVSYDVEFSSDNTQLALYGRNVSRNLFYEKIITASANTAVKESSGNINSSEGGR